MSDARPSPEGLPPQNLDAERAVLGTMLLDTGVIADVADVLKPEDFYAPSHQAIYDAILRVYEGGQPVDFITVTEHLVAQQALEQAGGRDYLVHLADSVVGAGRVATHAKIVKDAARLRALIRECRQVCDEASHCAGEQVDEFLDSAESRIFETVRLGTKRQAKSMHEIVEAEMLAIERNFAGGELARGVRSGFDDLDDMTWGFQPGDLIVIAGRPSMGKTAFALNIVENCATRDAIPVAFFSLEMSTEQVGRRLLCSHARVDAHALRIGRLPKEDRHRLADSAYMLSKAPIYVDDSPGISALGIRTKARRLKMDYDIKMAVVDYLQLMEAPRAESRQQEIAIISRSLKALARELEIPVLALSQLNRSVDSRDDKRPRMSDLRESGAIEQDADVIILLFREEYYKRDETNQGIAEAIIAKQRNGPVGDVKLQFDSSSARFNNLDHAYRS